MVVGRINGVVALTGFSYEEMYGRFAGTKKSGRNNEVVVRRGSTVRRQFITPTTSLSYLDFEIYLCFIKLRGISILPQEARQISICVPLPSF